MPSQSVCDRFDHSRNAYHQTLAAYLFSIAELLLLMGNRAGHTDEDRNTVDATIF